MGFVRPHEVEVSRTRTSGESLAARVRRVQSHGASVRVEVDVEQTARSFVAELAEQRFDELQLHCGETVFVSPRRVRLFEREGANGAA